jgi:hypothetical protein
MSLLLNVRVKRETREEVPPIYWGIEEWAMENDELTRRDE